MEHGEAWRRNAVIALMVSVMVALGTWGLVYALNLHTIELASQASRARADRTSRLTANAEAPPGERPGAALTSSFTAESSTAVVLAVADEGTSATPQPVLVSTPASTCSFGRGFLTLVSLLGPERVGGCVAGERTNPTNGNTEQLTTRGLLAWLSDRNTPVFTDGEWSWYYCSNGVHRLPPAAPVPC